MQNLHIPAILCWEPSARWWSGLRPAVRHYRFYIFILRIQNICTLELLSRSIFRMRSISRMHLLTNLMGFGRYIH